jgi:hypothetical protein
VNSERGCSWCSTLVDFFALSPYFLSRGSVRVALSKLKLVRGLLQLRFEIELVSVPCRHAKMVASSHPPLTDVMTERPCQLLHMDLVGPARVRSVGGK